MYMLMYRLYDVHGVDTCVYHTTCVYTGEKMHGGGGGGGSYTIRNLGD